MSVTRLLSGFGEVSTSFPARPQRRVSLFRAAALTHPVQESGFFRKRLKFIFRAWAQRERTSRWLSELTRPEIAPLWRARPRISTKLQRPYISCSWNVEQRLEALRHHYLVLPQLLSSAAMEEIYRDKLTLATLSNPAGRDIAVRLFYRDTFEKEGDLTLGIDDVTTGLTLAGITFSILRSENTDRHLIIGGLQASPGPQTREIINEVTKQFHGMRPKAFALWCVQQLAASWSISQICAVSDAQHIYRHAHKRRDFSASYDEFWTESDGTRRDDQFWVLPLQLRHRQREELKASRRKAHERRYAFLTAFAPVFAESLLGLRADPRPGADLRSAAPVFIVSNESPAPCKAAEAKPHRIVVKPSLQPAEHSSHSNHSF